MDVNKIDLHFNHESKIRRCAFSEDNFFSKFKIRNYLLVLRIHLIVIFLQKVSHLHFFFFIIISLRVQIVLELAIPIGTFQNAGDF